MATSSFQRKVPTLSNRLLNIEESGIIADPSGWGWEHHQKWQMFTHSRTKALSSLAWSVAPYHDCEYIEAWKYTKVVCRFCFFIVLYTEDTNLLLGLFNPSRSLPAPRFQNRRMACARRTICHTYAFISGYQSWRWYQTHHFREGVLPNPELFHEQGVVFASRGAFQPSTSNASWPD
jgi:hypothetical protein